MTPARVKTALDEAKDKVDEVSKPYGGIIMPIAAMPTYEATHWSRVREVLDQAIAGAGFRPRLVSESEDIGVIHSRIVQNLYDDQIVVCDVSGKNANVMFELGLRLAFDKPTIIVKDDETGYSFDTSPIKHIGYRKDQRFDDVARFQKELTSAILATVETQKKDEGYSPFLKHFGKFTPKTIESKEVPQAEYILSKLASIEAQLNRLPKMNFEVRAKNAFPRTAAQSKHSFQVTEEERNIASGIIIDVIINYTTHRDGELHGDRNAILKRAVEKLLESNILLEPSDFARMFDRYWEDIKNQPDWSMEREES